MLDAVEDPVVFITENNVAVLSHELYHKVFPTQISQLVQMFDLKADDPLKARLSYRQYPAICNMLSQKHTEVRRCHRAWFIIIGKI